MWRNARETADTTKQTASMLKGEANTYISYQ